MAEKDAGTSKVIFSKTSSQHLKSQDRTPLVFTDIESTTTGHSIQTIQELSTIPVILTADMTKSRKFPISFGFPPYSTFGSSFHSPCHQGPLYQSLQVNSLPLSFLLRVNTRAILHPAFFIFVRSWWLFVELIDEIVTLCKINQHLKKSSRLRSNPVVHGLGCRLIAIFPTLTPTLGRVVHHARSTRSCASL